MAGGAVPQKSDKAAVRTRQRIAEIAEVSEDTVGKVKEVIKSGDDDLLDQLRRGVVSVNRAHQIVRNAESRQ